MIRHFTLPFASLLAALACTACTSTPEKKPIGPVSDSSRQSWTGQVTSPIQGQFGMLPQNQHRR